MARVVALVRQGVCLAVNRERETSTLGNAFGRAIDGIRRERPAPFGLEHEATRGLSLQLG
jgi:hypothetical protein